MIKLTVVNAANIEVGSVQVRDDEEACDTYAGMLMDLGIGEEIRTERLD